jgi:hypothetical protein
MRWNIRECKDGFWARKTTGASAYIRRACTWPMRTSQGPGYDVNYRGLTVARIYFENKGATVKALDMCRCFPELSDLDLVEIALRVNKLRREAAAELN